MADNEVLVVAGEVSGDFHAAALVRAMRARRPDITFFGIGGSAMREAGVDTLVDVEDMAVMGFIPVLRRLAFFHRVFHQLLQEARTRRPKAVILVDYPGFNLRFAARAHALGLKVIYYICPQVWAWNRSRIPHMARIVDRLLAIFPFEKEVFEGTGLRVDFVGHPLVDETREVLEAPLAPLPWKGKPRVALLPGSREQEVERILPVMWNAAGILQYDRPDMSFILAAPTPAMEVFLRSRISALPHGPANVAVVQGMTRQILRQADAVFVASGTATVEAALLRCPMVICYRVGAVSFAVIKRLIRVPHIGMVNLIAGRRICPELIQSEATAQNLAQTLEPLLSHGPHRGSMLRELDRVKDILGEGGAADNAARVVLEEICLPKHL